MYTRTSRHPIRTTWGETLVTPKDTPSPIEGLQTSAKGLQSRSPTAGSNSYSSTTGDSEFKRCINTENPSPHSSSQKTMTVELPPPPAQKSESAVAVYCGSSTGTDSAFPAAAVC